MEPLIIRRYSPSDIEEIKSLNIRAIQAITKPFEGAHWNSDLDNIASEYIQKHGEFLVGTVHGKIVAMGALSRFSDTHGELRRMRVDPDFQRMGFGQQMLTQLELRARELGYKVIQLDTTSSLVGAQKLYLKNGYKETKRETVGFPEETIYYEKIL